MVELNYTVWIQMVNFLLLVFFLNFLLYKPVIKIIEKRNKEIGESNDEVISLDETIEQKMAEYEREIRQARTDAAAQKAEIEKEGAGQGQVIIGSVKDEISGKMEEFKAMLHNETGRARIVLRDQASAIAGEISEKVLGRGI